MFEKKALFIPVNERLHWSICIVVNPGRIWDGNVFMQSSPEETEEDSSFDDTEVPCILFMDSLKAHKKCKVACRVRNWLQSEAERLKAIPRIVQGGKMQKLFTEERMPVLDPKGKYHLYIPIRCDT